MISKIGKSTLSGPEDSSAAVGRLAPGKRTLTEALATAAPVESAADASRLQLGGVPVAPGETPPPREFPFHLFGQSPEGHSTHPAPPARVAEAKAPKPAHVKPNAVFKVIAYAKGKIIKPAWGRPGRWEGSLPQSFTGTRGPAGWTWDNPAAQSVRVNADLQGKGGITVEAWAGAEADEIVVYATAMKEVTSDATAKPDTHAPGHATDKRDAGDGRGPAPMTSPRPMQRLAINKPQRGSSGTITKT